MTDTTPALQGDAASRTAHGLRRGGYAITTDRARKLLEIRFEGFLTLDSLATYETDRRAAVARLGCRVNDHVTLCDFTGCPAQSQEVVGLFGKSLTDRGTMSRRIAVVVDGALSRMQAGRMLGRPNAACFATRAEGEAWLFEDGEPAEGRTAADPASATAGCDLGGADTGV